MDNYDLRYNMLNLFKKKNIENNSKLLEIKYSLSSVYLLNGNMKLKIIKFVNL